MFQGIGIDIITLDRVKEAIETSGNIFLNKIYTPYEQERAQAHPNPVAYLAMAFAAKEAIFKTFGIGWESGVQLREIEIREGKYGEPIPHLSGRFAELARERGVARVLLSLSYDGAYAVGVAALVET